MKNIWAVAATVIGFAVATSTYGEASAGPAASGVRASPETTSQESAPVPQAPVKVTDVRRYMSQFRKLLPGEKRLLLPIKQWKVSDDGTGFDICGGAITRRGECEVGGFLSASRPIPFVSPAEAVTAADPNAKLVEIEREKRYLRLIFRIDPASKATRSSLPSGSGISYGGVFPSAGSIPEEPARPSEQTAGFLIEKIAGYLAWLVPLGALGVVFSWLFGSSGSAPPSPRLVSTSSQHSSSQRPQPVPHLEQVIGQTSSPPLQLEPEPKEPPRPGYRKVVLD